MDELEGTLRGHIGVIEEALDRLEGKGTEADRGKKMYAPPQDEALPPKTLTNEGMNITESVAGTRSKRNDPVPVYR